MASLAGRSLAVRVGACPGRCLFVDLVYGTAPSPFLAAAAKARRPTLDGAAMLLHQGALAFEWWTGRRAPLAAMALASVLRGSRCHGSADALPSGSRPHAVLPTRRDPAAARCAHRRAAGAGSPIGAAGHARGRAGAARPRVRRSAAPLPVVDPRAAEVPRAALDAVPHSVARRQLLVPVDLSGPVLTVTIDLGSAPPTLLIFGFSDWGCGDEVGTFTTRLPQAS